MGVAARGMRKKITKRSLRSLELNETERLMLSMFVANNRSWVARYAVPLETVLRQSLGQRWLELLRVQQVVPHPVYELSLRLGRSSPATKSEIEWVVRQAFAAAGRSVKSKFAHAVIRGDRARVDVFVDGWLSRRNGIRKPRPRPFIAGRR